MFNSPILHPPCGGGSVFEISLNVNSSNNPIDPQIYTKIQKKNMETYELFQESSKFQDSPSNIGWDSNARNNGRKLCYKYKCKI